MAAVSSDLVAAALDREPLDALLWRVAGVGAGALAAVLAANPALAGLGPLLPQGLRVTIPAAAATPAPAPLVQLWD